MGVQMDEKFASCRALAPFDHCSPTPCPQASSTACGRTTSLSLALWHDSAKAVAGGGAEWAHAWFVHAANFATLRDMRDAMCMERSDLDTLLRRLSAADGSDLHLKVGSPPRMRVNGELTRIADAPVIKADDMVRIAKEIMQQRTWDHFDATNEGDFAYSIPDLGRFRVNAYRQRSTIGMVFRLVRSHARSFGELNLPEAVRRLADEQRGLILVTGPTGCGKTTTLAAMIDHINHTRECHIVTIEDPIEVLHHDELSAVSQREVGFDTATSSSRSARRFARTPT